MVGGRAAVIGSWKGPRTGRGRNTETGAIRRVSDQRTDDPGVLRPALESVVGVPFTDGNRIEVYRNGVEIFPPMLEAIRAAQSTIEFLTFIYWEGKIAREFAEALAERARAKVRVRVLLDSVGAMPMAREVVETMEAAGVEVRWFRPLAQWRIWKHDNRTHRKVLVVDGRVGFTGGVGIAEEWEGDACTPSEWRDTHFRVEGPAVHGLRGAFWGNWMEVEQIVAGALEHVQDLSPIGDVAVQAVRSTASIGWSDVALLLDALAALARRRLRIATGYFAPDPDTAARLRRVATRGVAVDVMIPGPHTDKRVSELATANEYAPLVEAGVRIWRYQPTMMHTKLILVDDHLACIGSANFNQRSMRQDDEIVLVVIDRGLSEILNGHFEEDLANCVPLDLDEWKRRGLLRRIREKATRLIWRET